jgi:hypothetical protein
VAGLCLAVILSTDDEVLGKQPLDLFLSRKARYAFFSLAFSVSSHYRWPAFHLHIWLKRSPISSLLPF